MANKVNKNELARLLKEVGAAKTFKEAHEALTIVFGGMETIVKEKLEVGDEIRLSGFGRYYVFETAEKTGRNPQNPSEEYVIPPQRVLKFKMSKTLKDTING